MAKNSKNSKNSKPSNSQSKPKTVKQKKATVKKTKPLKNLANSTKKVKNTKTRAVPKKDKKQDSPQTKKVDTTNNNNLNVPIPNMFPELWSIKDTQVGQLVSMTCYYKIEGFRDYFIDVVDQNGKKIKVTHDIINDMVSGTHFEKEVPMTMTGLAEILEDQTKDHVFTCCFHKQSTTEHALEELSKIKFKDLKSDPSLLAKKIVEGDLCTLTCHRTNSENNLGRSTVIDLNADLKNNFRQIDHRTIEYIIFKNVKYYLKKGSEKAGEFIEHPKDTPYFNSKELKVDNIFSSTSYYEITQLKKDGYYTLKDTNTGDTESFAEGVLKSCTFNACLFEKEEKICLTDMAKILLESNNVAFTICYRVKVNLDEVEKKLMEVSESEFKDSKKFAKDLLTGQEKIVVGRLVKSENKLGRSLVLVLPSNSFVQVDHRTLKWIIIRNIKYFVNK